MAWVIDLCTPYYRQDTEVSCGGAVAQMILASINPVLIDQDALYTLNKYHSLPDWDTSPDGLNFTLNAFCKPTFDGSFIVDRACTEPDGSANIVRTLRYFGVATGTLVYGGFGNGHWIAVRGAKTDVDPAGEDGAFSIEGFYINNPWPALSADRDVGGPEPGFPNEYVAYADWQNTYFTGCDENTDGLTRFISVCDPRRPPLRRIRLAGRASMNPSDPLISADEAMDIANRGVANFLRSNQICPLTPALRGARALGAHLVQRVDRRDEFYYLIVLHRDGRPTAVVRGDAFRGTFLGALALDGVMDAPIIAQDSAVAAARRAVIDRGDRSGLIVSPDGAFSRDPTLVWRPCQASCSPYYPLHKITFGDDTIYVGYDGTVYPTLHDLGRG